MAGDLRMPEPGGLCAASLVMINLLNIISSQPAVQKHDWHADQDQDTAVE
jgi:hypothetical protein